MEQAPHNERALLERVAAGDEQAFTRLFDLYFHALGEHIFRITRSHQVAEEIVQDVFLKIWIAREALLEVRDFRAYLFIASRNQAINAIKKAARENEKLSAYESAVERAGKQDEDENRRHLEEQYYSLLDQAIERLPTQQRTVFIMSRRQRKKHDEIAQEMALSKETVKKYIQHATRSISEYVRDNMDPALIAILLLSEYQIHHIGQLV
jgi:RNA polymerase sigma-70 factor (family 1)